MLDKIFVFCIVVMMTLFLELFAFFIFWKVTDSIFGE